MAIIKWTPFLEGFEDMEKVFSDLMPSTYSSKNGYVPAIDMYEEDDAVIIEAQLAGIDPEKVSISIENDVLHIKGESKKESEVEDKNYYRKEIRRGSFFRSLPLPTHVQGDKASAISEDGVLKISVPKAPESQPRQIKIQKIKSK